MSLQIDPTKHDPRVNQPWHTGNSGGILTVGEAAVEILLQGMVAGVSLQIDPTKPGVIQPGHTGNRGDTDHQRGSGGDPSPGNGSRCGVAD